MNKEDLLKEILKIAEHYETDTKCLKWESNYNSNNELIIESFDYHVNLDGCANFTLSLDEMARGIFRCILASNGKDWLIKLN